MLATISRTMTGRPWGDKRPFTIHRRFRTDDGFAAVECSADFWSGPSEAGEAGQYERVRWVEAEKTSVVMCEVTETGRREYVAHVPRQKTTCSFESDLVRGL